MGEMLKMAEKRDLQVADLQEVRPILSMCKMGVKMGLVFRHELHELTRNTRIMVWQILDELAHGMSPAEIVKAWGGKITRSDIAESVSLARRSLLDRNE